MALWGTNRRPLPPDQVRNVVAPRERSGAELQVEAVLRLVKEAWMQESRLHEDDRNGPLLNLCTDIRNVIGVPVIPGRSS